MKYLAKIDILPLKELLDPQGKTIANNLKNIDINCIDDVRVGKHIELYIDANEEAEARKEVEKACKGLLANMIMESYSYKIEKID